MFRRENGQGVQRVELVQPVFMRGDCPFSKMISESMEFLSGIHWLVCQFEDAHESGKLLMPCLTYSGFDGDCLDIL